MSMFQVTGQVVGTFFQPGSVDTETGEAKEGKDKVQIMGEIPVADGGVKFDLVTLSIPKGLDFQPYIQKTVSVPLGMFSPSKGNIIYFIPKGTKDVTPVRPLSSTGVGS